jgi:hypothetical protein
MLIVEYTGEHYDVRLVKMQEVGENEITKMKGMKWALLCRTK